MHEFTHSNFKPFLGAYAMSETKTLRQRANKNAVITVLVIANPKRQGTLACQRFDLYKDGMTVAEYIEAGGRTGDINYDVAEDYISLTLP
jgi:hypothetical protein